MNYEKKYKELVGKIEKAYLYALTDSTKAVLEEIRSELLESEDDKIRQEIIDYIIGDINGKNEKCKSWIAWLEKQGEPFDDNIITRDDEILQAISIGLTDAEKDLGWSDFGGLPIEEIKDWLEKQGEQNPADKIEPKFKAEDWITNNIETVQITGYDIDYGYQVDYKGNLQHRDTDIIEKEYHLWSIQDAKEGDVLAGGDWLFIFRKFHINGFPKCHCHYDLTLENFKVDTDSYMACGGDIYPATKEQRDLFFQKIREVGYEWDANKKELKKFHVIDEGKAEMDYCFTKMMNGEKDEKQYK